MEPFGYIYLIRNTVNGKVYVGQTTTTPAERWVKHLTNRAEKAKKYPLYKALQKYGVEAFAFTVLTTAWDRTTLDLKERILIRAYCAMGSKGYNCRGGGFAGGRLSPETKAKIGAANRGRVRTPEMCASLAARNLGRKHSEESKAKRSAKAIGRKMPPRSDEWREKHRLLKLGIKQSEETKERRAAKHRGRKNSPETIAKMSLAALNRPPESREKMRQAALLRWERKRQQK